MEGKNLQEVVTGNSYDFMVHPTQYFHGSPAQVLTRSQYCVLVSYGILSHHGNFSNDISYEHGASIIIAVDV
jgi:hypothetical protein